MKKTSPTKTNPVKLPVFVLRAEWAMRRAADNVRAQNRALNTPVIVWQDGTVVERPA